MFHCSFCDICRAVLVSHGEDFHSLLLSVNLQLFDCSRTIHITCGKKCFLTLGLKLACDLGGRCRLTGSLQTDHHDHGQFLARAKSDLRCLGAHEIDHLFVYDLDHHLSRIKSAHNILADRALLHILDKLLYDSKVNIRFKQSHLDFPECRLDIILGQSALAAQIFEYILQFFGKTVKCHPTTPLKSDSILLLSAP